MNNIKAIVCDLDGTLLNSKKRISKENIEILNQKQQQGIKIYIATGRGADAFNLIKGVNVDGIVLSNGMRVYYNNCQIYKKTLERDKLEVFCSEVKKVGIKLGIYKQIEENIPEKINNDVLEGGVFLYDRIPAQFDKLFVELENCKDKEYIEKKLPDEYYIIYTRDQYAFIMPKEVSKCIGVRKMLQQDRLDMSQVLMFGDDETDMELIKESGIGIAMGNALEEIKDFADFVTKTNDENGIEYMIKNLEVGKRE